MPAHCKWAHAMEELRFQLVSNCSVATHLGCHMRSQQETSKPDKRNARSLIQVAIVSLSSHQPFVKEVKRCVVTCPNHASGFQQNFISPKTSPTPNASNNLVNMFSQGDGFQEAPALKALVFHGRSR